MNLQGGFNLKDETRQEKFRRIATKRMSRIFSNMNLIANLSNKKNYMYSQQKVDELFQAYHDKGKEIRAYFESQSPSQPLKEHFFHSIFCYPFKLLFFSFHRCISFRVLNKFKIWLFKGLRR